MTNEQIHKLTVESLRDWFKKEKWVRITTSGNIAGDCGTSKNKKNPDRCLPKAKAQSLSKSQRAATARKKKKAGSKGKTVVKNTKKAKVTREDIHNLVVGLLHEAQNPKFKILKKGPYYRYLPTDDLFTDLNALGHHGTQRSPDNLAVYKTAKELLDVFEDMYYEDPERAVAWAEQNDDIVKFLGTNETLTEKDDRCTRRAKREYDTWPSAYASGAVVRCRQGKIWKKNESVSEEQTGKKLQDLQMGEKFTFNGTEYTFIELYKYPELPNAARVIKPDGKKSIISFGGGKVNTGKVAGIGPDYFGQGKGHHIDEAADSDIDTIIKLVKSAKNPKNLPISFGSTSVAIGGTQYDKGELVSMFNGKELGMDSMDIRKVFFNANKDAESVADKINASNSGVEAKIGYGYGKKPILYLKRK